MYCLQGLRVLGQGFRPWSRQSLILVGHDGHGRELQAWSLGDKVLGCGCGVNYKNLYVLWSSSRRLKQEIKMLGYCARVGFCVEGLDCRYLPVVDAWVAGVTATAVIILFTSRL